LTARNGSRVAGSVRWTSQNGRSIASSASRKETDVWVSPPAFTIDASKSRSWSRSIRAPSWFDWKNATVSPSSAARVAISAWMSSSVSRP
jgi:hypothetical protein